MQVREGINYHTMLQVRVFTRLPPNHIRSTENLQINIDKRSDLQEKNVILGIEEDFILQDFENAELSHPSPRKVDSEHIIYLSRELKLSTNPGRPVLTDFGEARFGQPTYADDIQPFQYQAPEVIFDIPWSYEVDIWNVGVMVGIPPPPILRTRGFH